MRCPRCGGIGASRPDVTWLGSCPKCQGILLVTLSDSGSGGQEGNISVANAPGTVLLTEEFLARYELLHPIGEGATASVFLGRDKKTEEKVAIKFLAQAGRRQVLSRFAREAKLLEKLRHKNVLRLLASGDLDGRPYLVSEFCEGGTLRKLITGKREKTPDPSDIDGNEPTPTLTAGIRMQPRRAIELMLAVMAGLEACHQQGVIHRDLKPENILLTTSGEIRVADLGVAREETPGEPSLTPMGAVIGTPRYMAPEQVRGDRATLLTDLYAAGVILFEMLAGRPPFEDDRTFELLRSHLDRKPPRLREKFPDVPIALESLVQRALSKSPPGRPASAAAFIAELNHCLKILDGTEPDGETTKEYIAPPPAPRKTSVGPLIAGGAVFIVILLGVIAGLKGGGGQGVASPEASVAASPSASTSAPMPSFELPDLDPKKADLNRHLDLGNTEAAGGHFAEARGHFRAALKVAESMAGGRAERQTVLEKVVKVMKEAKLSHAADPKAGEVLGEFEKLLASGSGAPK